jgi:hypothetical protein
MKKGKETVNTEGTETNRRKGKKQYEKEGEEEQEELMPRQGWGKRRTQRTESSRRALKEQARNTFVTDERHRDGAEASTG